MQKLIDFIIWIFSDKYGEYFLYATKTVSKEITEQVLDPNEGPYYVHDPMDYITVGTGKYITFTRQTWVAYHKKSGKPKYKTIDLP